MKRSAVSKRYARAFFELAGGAGEAAKLADDLANFSQAIDKSDELKQVLHNPAFRQQRISVVSQLAGEIGFSDLALKALTYLIERDRIANLADIVESLRTTIESKSGRLRAEVISAEELPEDRYQRIKAALERITGKMIVINKSVDPNLIGGVVTRVGSVIYDGSIRSQLRHFNTSIS